MIHVEIETRPNGRGWGYAIHHWRVRYGGDGEIAEMQYLGEFETHGFGYKTEDMAAQAARERLDGLYGEWRHI